MGKCLHFIYNMLFIKLHLMPKEKCLKSKVYVDFVRNNIVQNLNLFQYCRKMALFWIKSASISSNAVSQINSSMHFTLKCTFHIYAFCFFQYDCSLQRFICLHVLF